jgi:hypothetical protein
MTVLDSYTFDVHGNNLQMGYDILEQKDNRTTYRRYIVLNIVSGGELNWSSAVAKFYNPDVSKGLQYHYGPGSYELLSQDLTVEHNYQGYHTETISCEVNSGYVNWYTIKSVDFPRIQSGTPIQSFTGTSITGPFRATYIPDAGRQYKLRISIPYVYELQKFDNYVSNTDVYLNEASIQYIKNYTTNPTVEIGGVIESWKDGIKVGESEEILIYPRTSGGVSLRVNGAWKSATSYVRINGVWKEATPYTRVNNQWKEGI